tara:strand:- start:560 stop:982 length:423 start_codon:yes stop_codon:yes gene_type:complete
VTAQTHLKVRSYELDSYGHVNHAVYLNYFEAARFEAMEALGLSRSSMFERGLKIYVVRIEVDYLAQVFFGDALTIETTFEKLRRSSLSFHQSAVAVSPERASGPTVVARASVRSVWVSSEDGSPCQIPPEIPDGHRQNNI